MTIVRRYDKFSGVATAFDPLDDVCSWIASLRSLEYTRDLLRSVHGMTVASEIRKASKRAQTHAINALGFLDQAYAGPPAVSYLPLYYALLNLSKITIIAAGMGDALTKQPRHGASYNPARKASQGLLTEEIQLWRAGAFPLLYAALTGTPVAFKTRRIGLRDIYPYVSGVTYEFVETFGGTLPRCLLNFSINSTAPDRHQLVANVRYERSRGTPSLRDLKALQGFRHRAGTDLIFETTSVTAPTQDEALPLLLGNVRRCMLQDDVYDGLGQHIGVETILSRSQLLLPEELPIWMVFFHLSNVVRYNPEFLAKLQDSKSLPLLLALRKHSIFRYLVLFWSHINNRGIRVAVR